MERANACAAGRTVIVQDFELDVLGGGDAGQFEVLERFCAVPERARLNVVPSWEVQISKSLTPWPPPVYGWRAMART